MPTRIFICHIYRDTGVKHGVCAVRGWGDCWNKSVFQDADGMGEEAPSQSFSSD